MPASSSSSRRRVSRRRFWVRRIGLIVVAAALVFGVVRVVGSLSGSNEDVAGATTGPTDSSGDQPGSSEVEVVGTEVAGTDPVTTEPAEPESTGPPTSENPAKVYIVGDSDAGTFGPYLEQLLDGTGVAETELNYKVSSGLARPDFFNWPAELAAKLPEADPDIVVATFGGNDSQGLAIADGTFIIDDPVDDEAEWTTEYQRRVGEAMDLMLEDGRTVIWVGIPNDDSADVTARLRVQDQAVRAAAAERPDVIFIDTWKRFSGRDGNWAEYVIDPRDGQGKDVRGDDGFHLNENGAEILALDIAQAIRDDLRARGAQI